MFFYISIVLLLSPGFALPGTSLDFNPKFKLKPKVDTPNVNSSNGFQMFLTSPDLEVQSKGTRFDDEKVARQMSAVEFANIAHLFEAHGNPYEGQITEIVKCDKTYKPRTFQFNVGERKVKAILVGANSRRLFGACVKDQIAYWVAYFNFYDEHSKMVIENRVYLKTKSPSSAAINELSKRLKYISSELLVPRAES